MYSCSSNIKHVSFLFFFFFSPDDWSWPNLVQGSLQWSWPCVHLWSSFHKNLESGLIDDLQDSMWILLGHLAIIEKLVVWLLWRASTGQHADHSATTLLSHSLCITLNTICTELKFEKDQMRKLTHCLNWVNNSLSFLTQIEEKVSLCIPSFTLFSYTIDICT